jgi:hypothetical protein
MYLNFGRTPEACKEGRHMATHGLSPPAVAAIAPQAKGQKTIASATSTTTTA